MPSHTLDSTTESDEAEGGASQLLQRRARQASAMSTTASISRRLSFSTAHSNAVEVQRSSSDEESSASDDDDELGLGLTLPSKEHRSRRRTIVTPFSRPPSAVTSYSGPSRPSSAAPIDALRRINPSQASQRRPTPLATSSKLASLPSSPPTEAPSPPSPTRRLSRDGEQVLGSREAKGKGRAQEEHDIHGESSMMLDDPLDPLSSMLYRGASSASATEHEVARSKPGSARNGRDKVKSAQRKSIPPPPHEPPPASATSYPSSDSVASTSHVTLSSTGRSDPSSSNSTGASPASSTAPQPSLQQLLQTVDLSAALKLVQTLQSQQNQPPPITVAPPPPPPSEPSASHAAHQPASPAFAPFPPISPSSNALPPRQPLAFPPSTSVSHPLSPMPESPTPAAHFEGLAVPEEKEKKSDRRRSLSMSMGFGGGVAAVGKRLRTSSSASVGTMASQREGGGGLPRVKERVVGDERATMSEAARGFEEQISRVHLSLSPATLRRAQNCAKYLSLRYTPVYSALAAGVAPPNPVDVARWRQEKEEVERRIRRAKVGGSTSAVGRLGKINGAGVGASNGSRDDLGVSTDGEGAGARGRPSDASSVSSPLGVPVAAYGPRRNKYPKAWEVYPDEVAEYVAAGGKVEPADSGGAPLRAGISSLTRVSSTGSEHGGKTSSTYNSPAAPSSSAQWNGSPVLDSSPISVDRQYLGGNGNGGNGAHVRPDTSRENSYEGSPLARSGTSRTSASAELAGSSSLRHASSVNSGGAGGTLTPTLAASALSKNGEGALGIGNGYGSPRSRVASAHVSRDFLPSPTTTNGTAPTEPSSPRVVVNGHSPLLNGGQFHTSPSQSNALKLQSSSSTAQASGTSGVRSNISRRLDRIRGKMGNGGAGTEGETSDAGRGGASTPMARRDSADWASPDPSDGEHHPHHLSPGVTHPRSPYRSSLAQLSDQGPLSRRPKLRKNATSFDFGKGFDTDGYKSSGGEESGAGAGGRRRPSRGIFAAAWQGFKGSLDAYPGGEDAMGFGGAGGAAAARARAAARAGMGDAGGGLMRRRIVLDESDDEDVKVPREVLDLGDEEFAQLNSTLRHLRGELTHVDSLLPRVPALLNVYLDEITSHETSTRNTLGIPVHYAFPRLPASIVAELANTKAKEHVQSPPVVQPYTSDFTSETSSSEDSSTESSSDSDSDTEASEEEMPRRRRRPARQSSLKVHSRRVTDPISRKTVNRPRSHTTGFPFGVNAPSQGHPQLPHRGSDLANEHRVDPLVVLERVIEELEKVTKGIDEEAGKVQIRQEKVDAEINAVVAMVDEAQKTIDDGAYQQLRMLEDHYFRLRTSLIRPSSSVDLLWALLAGALTVVFWLSWLFVTFFRIIRSIVLLPLNVIKWLFFLR